jgi:hypothetical protein
VVAMSLSLTHKKMAKRCAMFRASIFMTRFAKHLLTCQALTLHWGITQPCHCKWGLRKDQGQRMSMLADCSVVSTARRKLVSLL